MLQESGEKIDFRYLYQLVQPYIGAEAWGSDEIHAHYKKHNRTLGHESDVLRVA